MSSGSVSAPVSWVARFSTSETMRRALSISGRLRREFSLAGLQLVRRGRVVQ